MRHILTAVGVAACLIAPAPAASADTAHCVSKAEFRNAKQGTTKTVRQLVLMWLV